MERLRWQEELTLARWWELLYRLVRSRDALEPHAVREQFPPVECFLRWLHKQLLSPCVEEGPALILSR